VLPEEHPGIVQLLGTHVGKSRFAAFVAPIAAKLTRAEQTISCTG